MNFVLCQALWDSELGPFAEKILIYNQSLEQPSDHLISSQKTALPHTKFTMALGVPKSIQMPSTPKSSQVLGFRDLEMQDLNIKSRKEDETRKSTATPIPSLDLEPELQKPSFRQFGNPAPLGLCGFALTTTLLSFINVQARSVTVPNIVIGLGIYFNFLC
jgi:GPR1/FUN34/yaaH family